MKRTSILSIMGLVCTLAVGPSNADSGNLPESDSLKYESLLQRISALEAEVSQLRDASYDSLGARIFALQAELQYIRGEFGIGPVYQISEDDMVSRGGQLYIPNRGEEQTAAPLVPLQDAVPDEADLKLSGFMDAVYEHNASPARDNSAYLNQVEVDIAKAINDRADAALGIIYSDGFRVGVAQIRYAIRPESDHAGSLLKSWSAAAGQFDAPFGEDVVRYPSNVRKTISIPEVVVRTHNLWNDLGVQTSLGLAAANVDAWLVRGFNLQSNSDSEEPTDELNVSGGTRLNIDLSNSLRCGGSCAFGWLPDGVPAMHMFGAHGVVARGSWSLTAEGVMLHEDVGGVELDRRGFYVQGIKEFKRFFAVARADHVGGSNMDSHDHLSCGAGVYLGSGLECRTEYVADRNSENNRLLVQVVATF